MNLFTNHNQELKTNSQIRAIQKCISNKNTVFDRLRNKMIKELRQ